MARPHSPKVENKARRGAPENKAAQPAVPQQPVTLDAEPVTETSDTPAPEPVATTRTTPSRPTTPASSSGFLRTES